MSILPKFLSHRVLPVIATFSLSIVCYAGDAPTFAIVVKPLVADGKVVTLDVRQALTGDLPVDDAPLVFQAPLSMFGVKSIAGRIESLRVTDAKGNVEVTVKDDDKQIGPVFGTRRWQAARKTVAPVWLHYRIATQPTGEGGPPYGMKPSGAGVAGRGIGFLVLPENTTSRTTHFAWNLSELPAGSRGAITAGDGATVVSGPPSEMATQWMLAGPLRVFNSTRSPGFHVYFLGEQPFNADEMTAWVDHGYATLAASLKYLGTPEYRLFFRALDLPSYATGTGREAGGGALMTAGNTLGMQVLEEVKTTVFHEMAHQWVGDLSGVGAWFVEGLTTYVSAVLPCQSGMAEPDFCAVGVNNYAENYYGATARNWSLARIDGVGSTNEDVRRVPYGRGMLYFALLNAQLLEQSRGQRGLLDVLAPMFVARANGVRLDEAAWEAMLLREIGQTAVADFRAYVIDGDKTILPPSDAFGPCLQRVHKRMKQDRVLAEVDGYAWQPIAGCRPRSRGNTSGYHAARAPAY
jgi:hypothetical protein